MRTKLLLTLIPLAVFIVMVTGMTTYSFSRMFLETAQERALSVTAYGMAREIESALESARRSLLFAAAGPLDETSMRDFLKRSDHSGRIPFREFALISPIPGRSIFMVASGDDVFRINMPEIPSAEMLFRHGDSNVALRPGDASLSGIEKAEYVLPIGNTTHNKVFSRVIRVVSPAIDYAGTYVMLSIDATALRNILSKANSARSPLWTTSPVSDARFSFFFDLSGWMLFQSNSPDEPEAPLMTSLARAGMDGTLGRPGLPEAFQPSAAAGKFWSMLSEVQKGHHGVLLANDVLASSFAGKSQHSLAYWPVTFRHRQDAPPSVYGGLAFMDYSSLSLRAGYKQVDIIFVISLAATALLSLAIFLVSRTLTRPLRLLARRVDALRDKGTLEPLNLRLGDSETRAVGEAINSLIETVCRQMNEIRTKDEVILTAAMQERASLEDIFDGLPPGSLNHIIPEIFGTGPRIEKLKSEIIKASGVAVDVLIEGETGTGKQLTAEAIHSHSSRASKPFISINCGELDENLLLDTLFGHIKGAFTEARNERKGAFVEAHGGTLFLDEIQSASAKVQQALLRALAMRVVRPLGSDKDVDVDVRIVAASNVNLMELAEAGRFRSDLYYRLRVLMIRTPALRDHRENIPRLARHFMDHAEALTGRGRVDLSRGALDRLMNYDWPGNVRELQNCMIMTVTMCESDIIQISDLHLEGASVRRTENALIALQALREAVVRNTEGEQAESGADRREKDRRSESVREMPAGMTTESGWNQSADSAKKLANNAEDASGQALSGEVDREMDVQSSLLVDDKERNDPVETAPPPEGLNARQAGAWEQILAEGEISRSRYEEIIGGDVSSRTAINDLQDLVDRGVLRKVGRGPSTRYVVVFRKRDQA
ncbi:MAG: sigma 54-interacting transcriptional regulator [Desulfovibrio sp.]